MKTKCTVALFLAVAITAPAENTRDLVVHEWGTFTSVQGADGALISWRSPQFADLPTFVHNCQRPGLNRQAVGMLSFGKGILETLQRMETPVIYFYTPEEMTIDVTVQFPKGLITEWYPQATRIGPAVLSATNQSADLTSVTSESIIQWRNIHLKSVQQNRDLANQMPMCSRHTHYYSARETDSAFVQLAHDSSKSDARETEKFLFYRGSGNFSTPLVVTISDEGMLNVQNTGATPLTHLFLLEIQQGQADWAHLANLTTGTNQPWRSLNPSTARKSLPEFQKEIGKAIENSLTSAGLFPAEASAMVKTWTSSWFSENGVRVLYLLPQAWTDEVLPLNIHPQPQQTVRVMVGRAEIITPQIQKQLAEKLAFTRSGDAGAKAELEDQTRRLGRFALPALKLADQYLAGQTNKRFATPVRN